ncbi:hypothetical protein [Rossellomorea marisflavi]|uniref:hypothetical protein n=1 Tax=Rossellomorea marisflavi TaxID=189381 RepID=UPI003FA018ED
MEYMVTIILGVILLLSLGVFVCNEQAKVKIQQVRKGKKKHWSEDIRNYNEGESDKDTPYLNGYKLFFSFLITGLILFLITYPNEMALLLSGETSKITFIRYPEIEYIFLGFATIMVWVYIISTKIHFMKQGYDNKYLTPSAVWSLKTKEFIKQNTDWDESVWKDVFLKYDDKRVFDLQKIQSLVRKLLEWESDLNNCKSYQPEYELELTKSLQKGIEQLKVEISSFDKWSYFHIPTQEKEEKETGELTRVEPQTLEEVHPFVSPDITDLERIVRKKDIPESLRMEAFALLKELKAEEEAEQTLKERMSSIEDAEITINTIKKMRAKLG